MQACVELPRDRVVRATALWLEKCREDKDRMDDEIIRDYGKPFRRTGMLWWAKNHVWRSKGHQLNDALYRVSPWTRGMYRYYSEKLEEAREFLALLNASSADTVGLAPDTFQKIEDYYKRVP